MFRFVACLVLCSLGFAPAAPVPPPRKLTAEFLVGQWQYSWGGMRDGWIIFRADGRYLSSHHDLTNPTYAGTWELSGRTLTLFEGCAHGDGCEWPSEFRTRYVVTLKPGDCSRVVGVYEGDTPVILSHRRE